METSSPPESPSGSDVTTVLFDLDGTICEYRRTTDDVLDAAFETTGIEPFFTGADWRTVIPEVTEADDGDDFREQCFGRIAELKEKPRDWGEAVAAAYSAERDHSDVRFLPGAAEALDALADEYRLGLVTNGGPAMQRPKLASLSLTDTFEQVVYAGSDTQPKPDPAPFHHILDGFGTTPAQALHVGNSLHADVGGALAAGVRSAWIPHSDGDEHGDHNPHHTLDSLHDLPTVL